jgi:hypothetical protein
VNRGVLCPPVQEMEGNPVHWLQGLNAAPKKVNSGKRCVKGMQCCIPSGEGDVRKSCTVASGAHCNTLEGKLCSNECKVQCCDPSGEGEGRNPGSMQSLRR